MPNYYAHLTFGRQVLELLPQTERARIEAERAAFDLGCLGPDPLFFYRPSLPTRVCREGLSLHGKSALPLFARLREAVEEEQPMAAGYTAGFLCHLALDSGCHGWIYTKVAEGLPTHLAIEREFDRLLMSRDGLSPLSAAYLPPDPAAQVCAAAARAYQHTSAAQFAESYRSMRRTTLLLSRLSGRRFTPALNRTVGRLPLMRSLRDVFLPVESPAMFEESNRYLDHQLLRCISPAAQQIVCFLQSAGTGAALDPWLDRDFKGTLLRQKSGAISGTAPAYSISDT